jgi:hypothetical protein
VTSSQQGNARHSDVQQACTVLFDRLPRLQPEALREVLEPIVGPCTVEWAESTRSGLPLRAGLVQFADHRIVPIALDAPLKEEVLERTVLVTPMPEDLRRTMLDHRATIRCLYMGDALDPVQQLTALYAVAGTLMVNGGLGIVNERAALAQPAEQAYQYMQGLGEQPPPLPLWVGVITYNREEKGEAGRYLLRTYGMEQFGKAELALYLDDRSTADAAYDTLLNVGLYLIEGGERLQMEAGHTVEYRGRTYLFTDPPDDDPVFSSPTGLYVLIDV